MKRNRNLSQLSVLMVVLALCGQGGLHLLFHAAVPSADSCCQIVSSRRAPTELSLGAADHYDDFRLLDFSGNYCPCCAGSIFAAAPTESFGRIVTPVASDKLRPGLFTADVREAVASIHPRAPPAPRI